MASGREPRNLGGYVSAVDLAAFIGVKPEMIRTWRMRRWQWIERGCPESGAIHAFFPDPLVDPETGEPFQFGKELVWDVSVVVRFKKDRDSHERKAGNPNWLKRQQ
jgi:hypothetical protein